MKAILVDSKRLPGALLAVFLAGASACAHGELQRECDLDLRSIGEAIEMYALDHKALPDSLEQLVPKYLKSLRRDPWGSPYQYVRESPRYRLTSPGPDHTAGTPDDRVRTAILSISN